MKKAIAIMLVLVMCLSLCACTGETKSNEIKLTLDNYDDYFTITTRYSHANDVDMVTGPNGYNVYSVDATKFAAKEASSNFQITVSVEGVSTNYQYSDISLVINLKGYYFSCPKSALSSYKGLKQHSVDEKFDVKCDINVAGEGKGEAVFYIPNSEVVPN